MSESKEAIQVAGMTIQFLVEAAESGGSVSSLSLRPARRGPGTAAAQPRCVRGDGLRPERRDDVDRRWNAHEIGPGDALCIPRGAVHGFAVSGDEDASDFLVHRDARRSSAPPISTRSTVLSAAGGGPPDIEALAAVMKRHGLTPAAPAPA